MFLFLGYLGGERVDIEIAAQGVFARDKVFYCFGGGHTKDVVIGVTIIEELENRVDFGASRSEIGGYECNDDEQKFDKREVIVVVVEEDADGDMEQNADNDTHNDALQGFVFGHEVEVAERTEGGHHSENGEKQERTPETIAVVDEERNHHKGNRNVVKNNAVEKTLVDVTIEADHRHAFEECVNA